MIKLLSKIFVKDNKDAAALRMTYGLLCSCVGVFLNVVLFVFKFIAGSMSGAISVTADAFNNLSDSGSSVLTMLGFSIASKKADPKHPFGHGRIEYLSGIGISILIILMGFELLSSSVKKIFNPEPVEVNIVVFIALGFSIAVKLYMFLYNRGYGRKYDSQAMLATSVDSISDVVSTSVVLISMLITYFTNINIDAYCGTAVAVFILYAGIKSAYETIQPLLGQPPAVETVESIEKIVHENGLVIGMHDLVVHDYGPGRIMISLHAEVPANGDLLEMHDEIDNIERKLGSELNCEAVIHMDPIIIDDEETNRLHEMIKGVCGEIPEIISTHDFRIVKGPTHTNLIFDIVVSHSCKKTDDELREEIDKRIAEFDSKYYTVVDIDKNYTETE